jgi:hypothetical protein
LNTVRISTTRSPASPPPIAAGSRHISGLTQMVTLAAFSSWSTEASGM